MIEVVFFILKHGVALAAALIVSKYAMDGMNLDSATISIVLLSIFAVSIGQWAMNFAVYLKTKLKVRE